MDKLEALGFSCVAGQIDKDGVNYGFLTPDGPALTPEGEALVKQLTRKAKRGDAAADPAPTDVPA